MPQSAKEFTDITSLIKLILNGYPGNSAIFREYLQNSDDAKAKFQAFILDERSHPTESLVDQILKGSQGAALIAVNDGILSDSDWMALRKINSSSKQTDESQTGKNGLGFRASYHLTENPHIISGKALMILDPHHEFTEHPGGITIDLIDESAEYQDQIAPFTSSIRDMHIPYKGTAFRLPLRTEEQANRSKIKPTPTSVKDMRDVLHEFAFKELEEVILFLKHITAIEIHHIDSSGNEVSFAKVTIDPPIPSPCPPALIRRTTVTSFEGKSTSRDWKFHYTTHGKVFAKLLMEKRLGYDMADNLSLEKLSPTVDVAFPLSGSPIRGRLFTLLPFPQYTNFSIHLNAVFALDTSRQGLKNIQEVGVANSRERRLVEWNKLIFDTWTPEIWADLLSDLSPEVLVSTNWSLWPPQEHGEDCYWSGLATALTNVVVSRKLAVFPTLSTTTAEARLVRIAAPDVLLASSSPGISLSLLSDLGIHIVQPPTHIFEAIISGDNAISQLSPRSLHHVLSQKAKSEFEGCADSHLKMIMDYLVFSSGSSDLKYIAGLPWFRCAKDNRRVCLDLAGNSGTKYFIPQTETEANIFVDHTDMLAWDTFSERLRSQLSQPTTFRSLKVAILEPSNVVSFLKDRLKHLQSTADEIANTEFDCGYIIKFWTWIVEWSKSEQFFQSYLNQVSTLFLLPTSRGSLRKLSSLVIHFSESDQPFVKAWNALDIYPIAPEVPDRVISKLRSGSFIPTPRTWKHISFLIANCNLVTPSNPQSVFADIRTYLSENLPRTGSRLTAVERAKLKRFPIFMVKNSHTTKSSPRMVDGHCVYVDIEDGIPLPRLKGYPDTIYIDVKDLVTLSFVRFISADITIEKELSILQLAVDNWDIQDIDCQDIFIDRIFSYRQLPTSLRQNLTTLPFVVVNGHADRKAPTNLIHPRSVLADLYQGEPGRMPAGRFGQDDYLSVMHSFGLVRSSLDTDVVQDRLEYLTNPSNAGDVRLFDKAVKFVNLLDREWNSNYSDIVNQFRSRDWLPFSGSSNSLVSPSQSRDSHRDTHAHPYYYDLVMVPLKTIFTAPFRAALGWSTIIPPEILIEQLIATIELNRASESSNRFNRLVKLITYLNHLHVDGSLSGSVLQVLRVSVIGRAWIPSNSLDECLIETRYALLADTLLKTPFRSVYSGLARLPLLRAMECSNRPPFDLLVSELAKLSDVPPRSSFAAPFSSALDVESAVAILQEIADNHKDRIIDSGINIPGDNGQAHPVTSVYFRDVRVPLDIPATLHGKFAAHNSISISLAQSLGIPPLSSLILGDDEEEEEEQMDTDFVTVIRQFLSDYDPQYALNEFLANANDARATSFSLLLDERHLESRPEHLISPKFQKLLSCETLILHNNAKLSSNDFKGIRKVGRGGKRGDMDTHGRHGLGALSLYYFTDVATIISGDSVMILDPSSQYLPPLRNGRKRTALTRKISEIVAQYPGQLGRHESLFDFSTQNVRYEGTIFCLPLHATITEKACSFRRTREYLEKFYRQLAAQALLFTDLELITAKRLIVGRESTIWSFSASRSVDRRLGNHAHFEICDLQIKEKRSDGDTVTNWVITTSETGDVPQDHIKTAHALKLTSNAKVQLAINIHEVENRLFEGYPFSTVSLPRSTSLPFHINARFAISSNRQDLVLNSADSGGKKDVHTSFNTWILETLIPPLYLETLQHLVYSGVRQYGHELKSKRWWLSECSDDVSRIIRDAFLNALPDSDHRVFKASNGRWISFPESVFWKDEPGSVAKILTQLETPNYVKHRRYNDIAQIESSTVVSPQFVREVLLEKADHILSSNDLLEVDDCYAILNYIGEESSLTGIPLLVLVSQDIVPIPDTSQNPVYDSDTPSHPLLFSSSQFIRRGKYSPTLIKRLLSDNTINVVALTDDNVHSLIRVELQNGSELHRIQWVHNFWALHHVTLPGPPTISSLESTGLPLVEGTSSLLPLSRCLPDLVVYNTGLDEWIIDVLGALKIELITDGRNRHLKELLNNRFKESVLGNVLQCIVAKGINILESLSPTSRDKLSDWIQSRMSTRLEAWSRDVSSMPVTKSNLSLLPIWKVHCNGSSRRGPSVNLKVLPSYFDIKNITPYLKRNTAVAPWSSLLSRFLEHCSTKSKGSLLLSPSEILSIVTLPTAITTHVDIKHMKSFIQSMLNFPETQLISCGLTVPDSDGTLRPIQELYDDKISLFAKTLKSTPRPSFLHADFKTFSYQLRKLGLVHEVTIETFRHCANAVSAAQRAHGPGTEDWNYVREMSTETFSVYQAQIPSLMLLARYSTWSSLDQISFVQRRDNRRQGASYHIRDNYCAETLSPILPPSRFVLPAHEPVAWTQRALFLTEPIDGLVTVNKTLGVPDAQEVVAHLIILATIIALDHPRDLTLLSDIKATYNWLNQNASSARQYLLSSQVKKLFLNVADPTSDSWTGNWASAEELVLNMEYDQSPLKSVQEFLKPYEALLRAAGCGEIKTSGIQAGMTFTSSDNASAQSWKTKIDKTSGIQANMTFTSSDNASAQSWKTKIDKMRRAGEFTDVTLVPTSERIPTDMIDDAASTADGDEAVLADDVASPEENLNIGSTNNGVDKARDVMIEWSELRAHRVMLAAAIPHLLTLQKWKAKPDTQISFYGSAFAAKAIIDFVYTGEIELSTQKTDKQELSSLMSNLLEVLPVADEWDMQDLKEKIQWEIVSKHRIIQRLPDEYDTLLDYATRYNADKIIAELKGLEPIRARIQRLREGQR